MIVRGMLVESARPMHGYRPNEVGAGFVCDDSTIDYLSDFNGLQLAEVIGLATITDSKSRAQLRQIRIADEARLPMLQNVARRSSISFSMDFRTGSIFASMRDPSMDGAAGPFVKEPSGYHWPPRIDGP